MRRSRAVTVALLPQVNRDQSTVTVPLDGLNRDRPAPFKGRSQSRSRRRGRRGDGRRETGGTSANPQPAIQRGADAGQRRPTITRTRLPSRLRPRESRRDTAAARRQCAVSTPVLARGAVRHAEQQASGDLPLRRCPHLWPHSVALAPVRRGAGGVGGGTGRGRQGRSPRPAST